MYIVFCACCASGAYTACFAEAYFVVHLGIIDILQSYGGKKQAEGPSPLSKALPVQQGLVSVAKRLPWCTWAMPCVD